MSDIVQKYMGLPLLRLTVSKDLQNRPSGFSDMCLITDLCTRKMARRQKVREGYKLDC